MPEGDTLRRAAARLQPLVGRVVVARADHPRARVLGIAEAIDGRRLERVEAVGKNLLLAFEGGLLLRSHLGMRGRWYVGSADEPLVGKPWLVLRAGGHRAVLRGGATLELAGIRTSERPVRSRMARLGPDVMDDPPDLDGMVARLRSTEPAREIGEALLDQRLVAGIGNIWRAEGLFLAGVSPWAALAELPDDALRRVLAETSGAMRAGRPRRLVYRKARRPCPRCGTPIAARRQGEAARTAYWCPACQPSPRELARRGAASAVAGAPATTSGSRR